MSVVSSVMDAATVAALHPVTVQVINQGPGIWGNVATGLITAGAAIAAVMLTHRFTLRREKLASEDRLMKERHFIATELVFLLEQYAEDCARVANEQGSINSDSKIESLTATPAIRMSEVSGDWRSLPAPLIYRIRELPVLQLAANRIISDVAEYSLPHLPGHYLGERQYQYAKLGLKALILAKRLRQEVFLQHSGLLAAKWSPFHALWRVWRHERKIRFPPGRFQDRW